jgi:hypothetical protein
MTLSEFAAMESAYRALQQLDPAARRRAVHWLTDALEATAPLPDRPAGPASDDQYATPTTPNPPSATPARIGRTARASRTATGPPDEPRRARRGRRADAPTAEAAAPERPYRRMPPVEEVLAAYRQVGSVSGLADHFSVPRHTAQGWARRLRREGHDLGRSS